MSIDQQFVEYVIKSLVTKPEEVKVERRIDEKGVLIELTVDPEDLGRVIGKRGATAQSVRTLLRALGTKNDARYNLKIVDNGIGKTGGGAGNASQGAWGGSDDDGGSDDSSSSRRTSVASDDDYADDIVSEERESDVVAKARRELADLDDLDV